MTDRTCSVDGCTRAHIAREFCTLHYTRWKKHGDPLYTPPPVVKGVCTASDCSRPVVARTFCIKHYGRWMNHGSTDTIARERGTPVPPCTIADCSAPGDGGRGWCGKHYRRYQRHGDPLATSRIVGDDEARAWSYVDLNGPVPDVRPDLGPCHLWTGALSADGYGILLINGRTAYMPRWFYELENGAIPTGLEPDHLCRVRECVNPEHLEPVTHRVNILRGESFAAVNARKTHCPQGHEYTPENIRRQRSGGRLCRTCQSHYDALRR